MIAPWVLVIEDDENIREVLKTLFELEGIQSLWAECGATALAVLESLHTFPSLILVDANLPDTYGPDLIADIRPKLPKDVAIYLVSANADFEERSRKDHGITGFIHKPFDADALVALAQNYRGKHRPRQEAGRALH